MSCDQSGKASHAFLKSGMARPRSLSSKNMFRIRLKTMYGWPNWRRSICVEQRRAARRSCRPAGTRLNLVEVAAEHRRVFLEDDLVVLDGRRGLAFLHELLRRPGAAGWRRRAAARRSWSARRAPCRAGRRPCSNRPAPGGSGSALGVFLSCSLARSMSWGRRPDRARTPMAAMRLASGSSA